MFIAIVLALVISSINGYVFWWISTSILFLLSVYFYNSRLFFNPLSITVFLFVVVLILNMVFVRPVNDPNASYLIVFFASGFLLFSFANEKFIRQSLYSICVLFLLLSLWGFLQYLTGFGYLIKMGGRANAIFYTPNTYAAAINVILLPLTVFYLNSKNRVVRLLPFIFVLFAALLTSQSRGGWVAFVSSLIFFFILVRVIEVKMDSARVKRLMLGFIFVFFTYSLLELVDLNEHKTDIHQSMGNDASYLIRDASHLIRSEGIVSTLSHRLMLYDIAWRQIKEKPFLGQGFHTYRYFQVRDQHAPHIGNATRFVHNDYLQLWMETGIFGLLLFISVPGVIIGILLSRRRQLSVQDRTVMLALTTGLIGFYVQALVDFLFYVPFLLMMYGCYLGYLTQLCNKYSQGFLSLKITLPDIGVRSVVIKSLISIFVVCYLSQPAIAQLAFDQANRYKNRLDIEPALKAYEIARRFAPFEASYYLVEADVWYNAAKFTGNADSAQRADGLYEKGITANPYAVANLFWRALLHRDMPELLSNTVSMETLLSWLEYVLHWLPNDKKVQADYVRTLFLMGKYEKGIQVLDNYLSVNPDSHYLTQVQLEIEKYSK